MIKVSFYKNVSDTKGSIKPLDDVLAGIKGDTWAEQVQKVHDAKTAEGRKAHKSKLPGFTAAGTFAPERKAGNLKGHSRLMVLDFDDVADLAGARHNLKGDKHVQALFLSPSGTGLKVLVAVKASNAEEHKQCFKAAERYFQRKYGLNADSGSDVNRLCFVSHDPDLYRREGPAEPFTPERAPLNEAPATFTAPLTPMPKEFIGTLLKSIPKKKDHHPWRDVTIAAAKHLNDADALEVLKQWDPEDEPGRYRSVIETARNGGGPLDVEFLVDQAEGFNFDGRHEWWKTYARVVAEKEFEPLGENRGGTSLFTDLSPYLAGEVDLEKPTIGHIEGDRYLFYSGRLNEIHGEPEEGKSNILLAAACKLVNDGKIVVFVDPEDTPRGIANRLRSFGAKPEKISQHFFYLNNPEPGDIMRASEWAQEEKPKLVCLDGLAELMTAKGLSEDKAQDVLSYFRKYVRPFTECGAAVVVSDHVVKDANSQGRWARGSGAKLGRYDGVSYQVKVTTPYGPNQAGAVQLTVSKDRNGGVGPRGFIAAEVHFKPWEGEERGRTLVELRAPGSQALETKHRWLISQVIEIVKDSNTPLSQRQIIEALSDKGVSGREQKKRDAIKLAIEEGDILRFKEGKAYRHKYADGMGEDLL